MSPKQVAVAMSGGVDSSIAAALLKRDGYEVSGVHMELWSDPDREHANSDLERTCQILDIPLHIIDLKTEFQDTVIDYFCREYRQARTPNPCIVCNKHIKFGLLLDRARGMGADYLATGHYARVDHAKDGYHLLKAVDLSKDQSYFLYTLEQKVLQYLLLPIGDRHKAEVRALAARLGLPASSRRDSRDVCFIPDNDYRSFVAQRIALKSGDIVDTDGRVLGKHSGLAQYTVGQRQGLGLASNKRLYVIRLDAASNRLVVGTEEQLLSDALVATKPSWVSGEPPAEPVSVTAKVRYKSPEAVATVHPDDRLIEVRFHEPQRAVAPGQSVVLYQGETVLGGGIIEGTTSRHSGDQTRDCTKVPLSAVNLRSQG